MKENARRIEIMKLIKDIYKSVEITFWQTTYEFKYGDIVQRTIP